MMTRNLKALGLALVAAFAMSAIASSAAHAEFPAQLTNAGTAIHSEQVGNVVLTRGTRTVKCTVSKLAGAAANGATEVTLTPTYEGCEVPGIGPATVTVNNCVFTLTFTADKADTFTGVVHLVCNDPVKPKQIEIHVYTSAATHATNTPVCTYDFTPAANQNLSSIDFTNEPIGGGTTSDWILAHLNVVKITSTSTIGSVLTCGPVNDATGTLQGTEKVKGTTAGGAIVGITASTK